MIIFKKANHLSHHILQQKSNGKKIGFVPTMGALHFGHLSLIKASKQANEVTVCSIFINPTQFNNPEDLKHYPVTIEKDIELLVSEHCDVLFLPSAKEVYPADHEKKYYDLGVIETILEGHYRPGHFQGVCQVVDRLLEIVQAGNLYVGQKDFQQCIVIKKLIALTDRENGVTLNIVPTVREEDGLAMSSRNLRLDKEQRQLATSIYKELASIKNNFGTTAFEELKSRAKQNLEQKGFEVDYIEIAKTKDLSAARDASEQLVVLAAATTGKIRLIDNLLLN